MPHTSLQQEAQSRAELGIQRSLDSADVSWTEAAEAWIVSRPFGCRFIGHDVSRALADGGYSTNDERALGGIMQGLAHRGLIRKTGVYRLSPTSNNSPMTEWLRTEVKR